MGPSVARDVLDRSEHHAARTASRIVAGIAVLPTGQSGEIYMTINTFTGFTHHNADEKPREIAHGDMATNGDVGYLDAEGTLVLNDRKRDMASIGVLGFTSLSPTYLDRQASAILVCPQFFAIFHFGYSSLFRCRRHSLQNQRHACLARHVARHMSGQS